MPRPRTQDARFAQRYRGRSAAHPLRPGRPDRGPAGRSDGRRGRRQPGRPGPPNLFKWQENSCEVVGFRDGRALVMPLGALDGITLGARADFDDQARLRSIPAAPGLAASSTALAEPIDGKGRFAAGPVGLSAQGRAPPAHTRGRVGGKLDLGVRALNAFTTCCKGQRMGIFAGSGVGKSTLLAMLARNTNADAIVIGLIGERGREVKEFIEDDLGRRVWRAASSSPRPPTKRRWCAARPPMSR